MGRHVADSVGADYQVFGVAGCAPDRCGAPEHPNVTWFEADVLDRERVSRAFRRIREMGGADLVIFLAAPGGADEARVSLNTEGLRNVLDACRALRPRRFVLASAGGDAGLLEGYADDFPVSRIAFEARPRVIVVGASGFIGRYLVEALKEDHQVVGLARTSQAGADVAIHPNVEWHQVDIGDRAAVAAAFRRIAEGGPVDLVLHLAAYYDFTGEAHPEYRRTNVDGLRNVLDRCRELRPRVFVFASSVAACGFPATSRAVDETSAADGDHPYAVSKRLGEAMLAGYRECFPSIIVRLGATFSDWCEYPPLFVSLERWRSRTWDRRILGGRGDFAIPYIHVRDVQSFFLRLLTRLGDLGPGETVIASTDAAVAVRDLYRTSTTYLFGRGETPLYVPRALCRAGLHAKAAAARLLGQVPFERPWMAGFIDRALAVDASRTRERLGWAPRERLHVLRRMPFLLENFKNDPGQWQRRNHAILRRLRTAAHLRVHRLLEENEDRIVTELAAPGGSPQGPRGAGGDGAPDELRWGHRTALHQLMNAVRTRDMAVYLSFCRDLATRRFHQGFTVGETSAAVEALGRTAVSVLRSAPESADLASEIEDLVSMSTLFGRDQVEQTFEDLTEAHVVGAF